MRKSPFTPVADSDEQVVSLTLRANYHLVLNHQTKEPTGIKVGSPKLDCSSGYTSGSDGCGAIAGTRPVQIAPPWMTSSSEHSGWSNF